MKFPKPEPRPRRSSAGRRVLAEAREVVRRRDGGRCRVCGAVDVEVHHLRYRSRGGGHEASNLVCLCARCHRAVHAGVLTLSGDPDRGTFRAALRGEV